MGTGSVAVSSVSGFRRSARIAKVACLLRPRSVDGRGHGGFSRAICVFFYFAVGP